MKGDQEVHHQNNDSGIEDLYIIPEVLKEQEIIYEAHTKHDSHLKVESTYKEILKAGYRWDNMLSNMRDFYFKWQVWEIRTTKPRKNVVVKHIDSSIPKERYQADTVQLSKLVMSEDYKYLFTMVDHFTKYCGVVPLKNKTSLTVLRTLRKWITTHNIPMILQTDNGTEFKNKIINRFCFEKNLQQIYGVPYNPLHQGAVEAFNRTVQNFLTLAKYQLMDSYNLEDSITDFLLYYNGRRHSTTKVAPYHTMMNWWAKELMEK